MRAEGGMTLTFEEEERRWYMIGSPELADVFHALDTMPKAEDFEKAYESPMEQSEFRRALLEDIQTLCKVGRIARFKETKELAENILRLIENSYVEL